MKSAKPALDVLTLGLRGRCLIEASAGTGKTWTITGLYVRLLLDEALSVEQILVVTYTKAATAELKDRIRRRLVEALRVFEGGEGDEFCTALAAAHADDAERAARRLRLALQMFDEAAIYTIHGFCQRVLQEAAFAAGSDFDTELVADESSLVQALIADAWRRETADAGPLWAAFLAGLNQTPAVWSAQLAPHFGKPFLRAVELPEPPITEAQEAGVLSRYRQARMLWCAERETIVGLLGAAIEAKTLNGASYKLAKLATQAEDLSHWLATDSPEWPLKKCLEALKPFSSAQLATKTNKGKITPEHAFFPLAQALSESLVELESAFVARLNRCLAEVLARCQEELPARKATLGVMSFNDLLNRLEAALDGEGGHALAAAVKERFRAALIDEFQDTDPVQYRIFERIYRDTDAPLFFVGDPKQAIYSFRGADMHTYLAARGETDRRESLGTNRRSAPQLVAAINALFDPERRPAPFLEPRIEFEPVGTPGDSGLRLNAGDDGAVFRVFWGEAEDGEGMSRAEAQDYAVQATADEIARLLAEAELIREGSTEALTGGDIAVLVGSGWQARQIEIALAERGVASVRRSQDSVYQSAEALELWRLLAALLNPSRRPLVAAALATEALGFRGRDLVRLNQDERAWGTWIERLLGLRDDWRRDGFMRAFRHLLGLPGADGVSVGERVLRFADGERRITNWLHLAELIQVESRRLGEPERVLAWFQGCLGQAAGSGEEREDLLRLESDAARVQLVTIHSSKGLEYPIVFCPFLWDEAFESHHDDGIAVFHDAKGDLWLDLGSPDLEAHRTIMARERFAERLRLLYVALTRAKLRQYIVWGAFKPGREKGQHAAALAWLWHAPEAPGDEPLEALEAAVKGKSPAALKADVEAYFTAARAVGASVAWQHQGAGPKALAIPVLDAGAALAPAVLTRTLEAGWRVASFSGLTAGHHQEAPDRDQRVPEPPIGDDGEAEADAFSIHRFPRGATAGSCLHEIFELWEFTRDDPAALRDQIARSFDAWGLVRDNRPRWLETVARCVRHTLDTPLDGNALCLAGIGPERRLAELEFTLPVGHLALARLKRLLCAPESGLPEAFRSAAARLGEDQLKGYLKGFIDLVFEADGRFHVLDWKSNSLGRHSRDYTDAAMTTAMADAHYYLQALLYLLALHRYLRRRLPDYDYQRHVGGAWYLFLRGIVPGRTTGIFQFRPTPDLIDALDRLFAGEAIDA